MKPTIPEDDAMYATKHVKLVGIGWYFLVLLLIVSTVATAIAAVVDNEFTLWPVAFFIGLIISMSHVGKLLLNNGYVYSKDRKKKADD